MKPEKSRNNSKTFIFFTNYNKNTDEANEKVENRRIGKMSFASGKTKMVAQKPIITVTFPPNHSNMFAQKLCKEKANGRSEITGKLNV